MHKKANYSESIKKLRSFLKIKESSRRKWAKEKWTHTDGKAFSMGRILVPVLSVAGIFLMVIVCMIRFANIPEINRALVNNMYGTNNQSKQDPMIYPFFILVFIAVCILVWTAFRFIKSKFSQSAFWLFGSSLFLSICALLRYGADQGIFPDNSSYDGAPTFTYFEYCLFTLAIFAALTIYSLILIIIILRDKKEFNRLVDNTILNIIPKNQSSDLLSEDDYSKLIDEYIDKEKEKLNINKK